MSNTVSFSQSLTRLEEIIALLENPQIDLEDGIKLLEEGVQLHKACMVQLNDAQSKITHLLREGSEVA
ncbi:MAG: exodeoxyribonuclease VII small subunit [bacterium]|nr:exodeoxyribonuclease VII small subunit [bacterium]